MSASRREFLALSTLSVLGAAAGLGQNAGQQNPPTVPQTTPTPGAPPAFGTAPPLGPEVSAANFEAAEKLVNFTLTEAERAQAASNWRISWRPITSAAWARARSPLSLRSRPGRSGIP